MHNLGAEIAKLDMSVVDVPANHAFVLGDTPLPQDSLSAGFSVPISATVAIEARPGSGGRGLQRRMLSPHEVQAINDIQKANSLKIVVASDRSLL